MAKHMKKNLRYGFRELASRITGLSIPVFGISWQPPESERSIVRSVLVFLEDRRVLYNPFAIEVEYQVTDSVLEIRTNLTDAIQHLPDKSEAIPHLRGMRAACREYLDNTGFHHDGPRFGFMADLGRLRTIFGYHIAKLAIMYGIDLEGELAAILPPEYKEDVSQDEDDHQDKNQHHASPR
jgi:hypothetical protein